MAGNLSGETTPVDAQWVRSQRGVVSNGTNTALAGGAAVITTYQTIPLCTAAPTVTGGPVNLTTGNAAIFYCSNDSKLYVYDNVSSTWKASAALS